MKVQRSGGCLDQCKVFLVSVLGTHGNKDMQGEIECLSIGLSIHCAVHQRQTARHIPTQMDLCKACQFHMLYTRGGKKKHMMGSSILRVPGILAWPSQAHQWRQSIPTQTNLCKACHINNKPCAQGKQDKH